MNTGIYKWTSPSGKSYIGQAVNLLEVLFGSMQSNDCMKYKCDLTVDPYTQAANGKIRLVVNAYFDAKPQRANSFVKKVLA